MANANLLPKHVEIDENKHNLTVLLSKEKLEYKNLISKVYRTDGLIAYILK